MKSSTFKNTQLKYLCSIIGSKPEEIEYITNHIDDNYREWREKKINKKTGDFKKFKDGTIKERVIRPSIKRLKILQSAIKDRILSTIPLPDYIQGGVKGRSNITNGKHHQGKKYQFTTDLQDFFPNINHNQVYHVFLSLEYSDHIAHWLTKLTTWKGQLPQGTPTSTHIANLVSLEIDKKLIALSKEHNLTYTRFVDDLTFSSQQDFKPILNKILDIVKNEGFKISYRKTKYEGNQLVTGIEIRNNYIDAPKKIKIKATEENLSENKIKPYTNYLQRIRGTNKNILMDIQDDIDLLVHLK